MGRLPLTKVGDHLKRMIDAECDHSLISLDDFTRGWDISAMARLEKEYTALISDAILTHAFLHMSQRSLPQ